MHFNPTSLMIYAHRLTESAHSRDYSDEFRTHRSDPDLFLQITSLLLTSEIVQLAY
jgi:hypothetical protein